MTKCSVLLNLSHYNLLPPPKGGIRIQSDRLTKLFFVVEGEEKGFEIYDFGIFLVWTQLIIVELRKLFVRMTTKSDNVCLFF